MASTSGRENKDFGTPGTASFGDWTVLISEENTFSMIYFGENDRIFPIYSARNAGWRAWKHIQSMTKSNDLVEFQDKNSAHSYSTDASNGGTGEPLKHFDIASRSGPANPLPPLTLFSHRFA